MGGTPSRSFSLQLGIVYLPPQRNLLTVLSFPPFPSTPLVPFTVFNVLGFRGTRFEKSFPNDDANSARRETTLPFFFYLHFPLHTLFSSLSFFTDFFLRAHPAVSSPACLDHSASFVTLRFSPTYAHPRRPPRFTKTPPHSPRLTSHPGPPHPAPTGFHSLFRSPRLPFSPGGFSFHHVFNIDLGLGQFFFS